MPNRRISADNQLAPIQEISVQPFHSYDSDNVNRISRIVSGGKGKDFIVNGFDVSGIPVNLTEDLTTLLSDGFGTLNPAWQLTLFEYESHDLKAPHDDAVSEFFEAKRTDIQFYRYNWYKVEFTLKNIKMVWNPLVGQYFPTEDQGTPYKLHVTLGGIVRTWEYPIQKAGADKYTVYIQAQDTVADFRVAIQMEQTNPNMPSYSLLDDIQVSLVNREGGIIKPIIDITVEEDRITAAWLRPHLSFKLSAGVAIKDDTMLNILGTDPDNEPIINMSYSNIECWIKRNPYADTDFIDPIKGFMFNGGQLYDDGDPAHVYDFTKGSDVKWAYLCIYYSYFKSQSPNKAYIGLVRPETIEDEIVGEDYLIIAKMRFVTKDVVDAIFYYPKRKDIGTIDAARVTYLLLGNLPDWDEVRPQQVSQALDILAARIFNEKGVLFFSTVSQFENWKISFNHTGIGHGPEPMWRFITGLNQFRDYDKLAYIVQTNEWYRSRIINYSSENVFELEWDKISPNRFEINWSDVNSGNWPLSKPSSWKWYNVAIDQHPAFSDNPGSKAVEYFSSNLSNDYKTLQQAKDAWPYNYYVVESTGVGSVTIINPFNLYGVGSTPGPKTQDVKLNKFQRADNTWQNVPPGTLVFNDYVEFKLWFNAANDAYTSTDLGPDAQYVVKPGRVPDTDYDRLIYVIDDNSWWRSPSNASTSWTSSWTGGASKTSVPVEMKPISGDFQVNWSLINSGNWPAAIPLDWTWVGIDPIQTTLDGCKNKYPKSYYVVIDTSDSDYPVRIVNPFNSLGYGYVPGPTPEDIEKGRVLKASGKWGSTGALDIHFEAKGTIAATDNLVQGMCGHNGVLKGVYVWSDIPIAQSAGNGLKVDILLTKELTPGTFTTKSIFTDSNYSGGKWSTTHPQYSTGSVMPELHQ